MVLSLDTLIMERTVIMACGKYTFPSRPDAVRLRRTEREAMFYLMFVVHTLIDVQKDLNERLDMVDNGQERFSDLAKKADALLQEIRTTIPENQRDVLQRTIEDCKIRMVPKTMPDGNVVIVPKETFRTLVDSAKVRCNDCIYDDTECEQCDLFQLFTTVMPMDDYHIVNLCPYNLGVWKN